MNTSTRQATAQISREIEPGRPAATTAPQSGLGEAYRAATVREDWRPGDVMIVDDIPRRTPGNPSAATGRSWWPWATQSPRPTAPRTRDRPPQAGFAKERRRLRKFGRGRDA